MVQVRFRVSILMLAGLCATLWAGEFGRRGTPALAGTIAAAPRSQSSTTLFSDTFSDGSTSAWTPVRGQWATCRPKPGAAYLYCTRDQSDSDSFAGSAAWGDYALTASVLPLNTGGAKGGVRYGADIAVRVQDPSHYDELEIVRERDGLQHWEMWHNAGGAFTLLAQGTYSFREGSTYYLRLVAQGPQLTASVSTDNVAFAALGTALEPTYLTGSIGLRTWGGMAANFGNVLVTSVPGAPATPIPNLQPEKGKAADAFVDSVGVNTHFDHGGAWQTLFGAYSNALLASGIRHMRDGANGHSAYLQQRGVGLLESFNVGTTAPQILQNLNAVHPEAVEPMNEYDTYHDLDKNWVAHLHAEQTLLYTTVHSNSKNAGIAVLGPSLAGLEGSVSKFEDMSQFIDAGNEHDSTCNFNPGTDNHDNVVALKLAVMERELKNKQPIWTTETAFHNDPAYVGCYEPESVSAKYLPRMFAIRWNFGQPRVYIYALADEWSGSNSGQGLLHNDGSPKLQYQALKSMLSLLSDRGPAFDAPPLFYTVTGSTQNVQHVLLQKRDGSYWLMLWIEASGWNRNLLQFTPVPAQTVKVGLEPGIKAVTAYTYDAGWKLVPAAVPLAGHWAALTLSDKVTFLRLK